jgi:hypothetical protein
MVLSSAGGAVAELDAGSCGCLKVLAGPKYSFDEPDAIVVDGAKVFVANAGDGSVTEFPA